VRLVKFDEAPGFVGEGVGLCELQAEVYGPGG
jgi:hypothetical protein